MRVCAAVICVCAAILSVTATAEPTIDVFTDKGSYDLGGVIEVSLSASNPGEGQLADVYVAFIGDDGEMSFLRPQGWGKDLGPWMENVFLSGGLILDKTALWWLDVPNVMPPIHSPGQYSLAVGFALPGTLEFIGEIDYAEFTVTSGAVSQFYVDGTDGDDANDGSQEHPWKTIAHALAHVAGLESDPAEIHVAAGTYSPSTNGEIFPLNMLADRVSIAGEGAAETIIDAEGSGYHVLYCGDVSGASIAGVTISGGSAMSGCLNDFNTSGAGICCVRSSLSVSECAVVDNSLGAVGRGCAAAEDDWDLDVGLHGGGIYCYESLLTVEGCTVSDNLGDGIHCQRSSARIANCRVAENEEGPSIEAGVNCEDSTVEVIGNTIERNATWGIYSQRSSTSIEQNHISENGYSGIQHEDGYDAPSVIRDNTIVGNLSAGLRTRCTFTCPTVIEGNLIDGNASGGIDCGGYELIKNNVITNNQMDAMYAAGGINMHVASSTIVDNVIAFNSSTGSYASAVFIEYGAPILFNNLIYSNHCDEGGAAIYVLKAPFGEVAFNTIADNYSSTFHYGIYCAAYGDDPSVWGDIIWGNGTPTYNTLPVACCMDGDEDQAGSNILDPPMFVSGPLGDYYLDPDSPCIDAGSYYWASYLGLSEKTTQADGTPDIGIADIGYHYPIP